MDPAEPPSIELKLISCKDLKAFNFFQKLTIYAAVSIASDDPRRELTEEQRQQQRTKTHREADGDGGNPEWNHAARFDLGWASPSSLLEGSGDDLFFRFEFRHDGVLLGDKLVGECRVPVADLVRESGGVADVARFVSYEVRSGEGKPNGIFNFSYKLKGTGIGIGIGIGNGNDHQSSQILEGRISGYPVLDPEDGDPNHSLVQYRTSTAETGRACCYPSVGSVYEGFVYSPSAAAPPQVSSFGECGCYYPSLPPPPRYPYPPPPPPPPPVGQGVEYYPPHPWPSGRGFDHRW